MNQLEILSNADCMYSMSLCNILLDGKIVLFHFNNREYRKKAPPIKWTVILKVRWIMHAIDKSIRIYGDNVAGDSCWEGIAMRDVTDYRILEREDLPMYIGMDYVSPLLDKIIRGDYE